MPTFLVLKSGSVVETIRGANPSALTAAVRKAANDAGAKSSAVFQSKGYTLGSATQPARPVNASPLDNLQRMMSGNGGLLDTVVRFFGLYITSLLSFDSYRSAEESPFNIRARR